MLSIQLVKLLEELVLVLKIQNVQSVVLFLGPTGVGKTELARALAESMFGETMQ